MHDSREEDARRARVKREHEKLRAGKKAADPADVQNFLWAVFGGLMLIAVLAIFVVKTLSNSQSNSPEANGATKLHTNRLKDERGYPTGLYVEVRTTGRQELRKTLRDPDSLRIIDEEISPLGNGRFRYHARFRAKNGFGGYGEDEFAVNVRK